MNDPKSGKLVTVDSDLKKHTVSYYENVLRNREINEDLKDHKREREELCQMRLEETKENKTEDWTKEDLVKAQRSGYSKCSYCTIVLCLIFGHFGCPA